MSDSPQQGEVWWARLDPVEGSEQAKTRPVLVVSIDEINRAPARLSIVCPLTTTPRDAAVRVELAGDGRKRVGYIEPYQVRTVSQQRFERRIGRISYAVAEAVASRIALYTRPRF